MFLYIYSPQTSQQPIMNITTKCIHRSKIRIEIIIMAGLLCLALFLKSSILGHLVKLDQSFFVFKSISQEDICIDLKLLILKKKVPSTRQRVRGSLQTNLISKVWKTACVLPLLKGGRSSRS